ncbi:unnamed protein product [Lampetra fluviatilis]
MASLRNVCKMAASRGGRRKMAASRGGGRKMAASRRSSSATPKMASSCRVVERADGPLFPAGPPQSRRRHHKVAQLRQHRLQRLQLGRHLSPSVFSVQSRGWAHRGGHVLHTRTPARPSVAFLLHRR